MALAKFLPWITFSKSVLAVLVLLATPAVAQPGAGIECRSCSLITALADDLANKAVELTRLSEAAGSTAQAERNPQAMRWPGPARLDSDSTVWTRQQRALLQSRAANRAAQVAKGTDQLAKAAARAVGACSLEQICMPGGQGNTSLSRPACAVFNAGMSADLDQILAPVQAAAKALEAGALTCLAMACPGADCSARNALLERAAFAEGILSAATGEVSIALGSGNPGSDQSGARPSDATTAETGIAALFGLTQVLTLAGLDAIGTQKLATELAGLERRLGRPKHEGGQATAPRWRQVSARLALAGMRDALGTLRLEGRPAQPTAWAQAAKRLEAVLKALMRLEQATGNGHGAPQSAAACPGVDPRLTRTLFRLRRAVNSAAICSVRSGCSAQEAMDAGAARAKELVTAPVFEPQLELIKALEEEVVIAPDVFSAANATSEPAPRISPDRQSYQQGAAIALDVEIAGNRCLAEGGHLAIVPTDEAAGAPPALFDDITAGTDTARIASAAEQSDTRLLFRAPQEGVYSAAIYAQAADGGALLAAVPIRVSRPEPIHCDGWTGVWNTEFGRLVTIEDEDGKVTGTYGRSPDVQPGFIFGRVRDNQFRGVWMSEISTGGTRLTLAEEGNFSGSWGLTPQQVTNGGRWSGTCIAQPTDENMSGNAN